MEKLHEKYTQKVDDSLVGELFHQHTIIKAFVRNPPLGEEQLQNWLSDLVSKIGMKIVIGPFAKYVSAVGNSGVTGIVVIETSHISCHVWDEPNPAMIQLDCYSCSYYGPKVIADHLKEFGLLSYEMMVIDRNKEFRVVESKIVDLEAI